MSAVSSAKKTTSDQMPISHCLNKNEGNNNNNNNKKQQQQSFNVIGVRNW